MRSRLSPYTLSLTCLDFHPHSAVLSLDLPRHCDRDPDRPVQDGGLDLVQDMAPLAHRPRPQLGRLHPLARVRPRRRRQRFGRRHHVLPRDCDHVLLAVVPADIQCVRLLACVFQSFFLIYRFRL